MISERNRSMGADPWGGPVKLNARREAERHFGMIPNTVRASPPVHRLVPAPPSVGCHEMSWKPEQTSRAIQTDAAHR